MAQVSQSPLRRLGLNTPNGSGVSSSMLNHLPGVNQPIRAGHSSLSLASSSFIIEDKLHNEIRKLQSELKSEKEKNEALNSQLNINSGVMAAFEQSLATIKTRLRQLTTLNEKKDNEIEKLKEQLGALKSSSVSTNTIGGTSPNYDSHITQRDNDKCVIESERDSRSERDSLLKTIEELRRQLIEKDRLLTDTRLEALSAAHQLEQLESKMNGDHSLLANEDDLDEGVMVVNHSPSDSDAITDSAHFSEINNQTNKSNQRCNNDNISFSNNLSNNSSNAANSYDNPDALAETIITDDHHSSHSSEYQVEARDKDRNSLAGSISQQFEETDSDVMSKLIDNLLLTN